MAGTIEELERIMNDVGVCALLNQETIGKVINVLNCNKDVKPDLVQKLLEICLQTPKEDVVYAKNLLNIISLILRKGAADEFSTKPDLLPSMLNLVYMLNTTIYSSTSDEIKVIYFKMLLSYPEEIYGKLNDDDKIMELFNLYIDQRFPIKLRVQPIQVLHKYVKVSSPEKRRNFVEKGIHVWFQKLIPSIMSFVDIPDFEIGTCLPALEVIADEFQHIDYYEHYNSYIILQGFFEKQKYPTIMKNLVTQGSNIWHRLWIIFVKILKTHLTKTGSAGSPINSMLPVVETAFKMDVTNRCRAFECWNALIDNFATETSEMYINKRIKLLVIPLNSNNAKIEETVIAKIKCWWHLICSYYSKLSNFAEIIMIPFLHFCFGKPNDSGRTVQIPGMMTYKTKEYCVKALVNIFGHHNCGGCVDLPVSKNKILNEQYLLPKYTQDILHAMKAAIKIVASNMNKLRNPYKCGWTSFIKLIDDLNDDKLQRTVFIQLMETLENLLQASQDEYSVNIVLNDMITTLLTGDGRIKALPNLIQMKECPVNKILLMILNPSFGSFHNRNNTNEAVDDFKPFTDLIVENYFNLDTIDAFLNKLVSNYKSLIIWTAMARSISEKCIFTPEILRVMLHWPLKQLDLFCYEELSMKIWFVLFNIMHMKGGVSNINDEIMEVLSNSKNDKEISSFLLNVAIDILRKKIATDKEATYGKEVTFMYNVCNKFNDLNHTHPIFAKLIDIILELFCKLLKDINMEILKQVLKILKLLFIKLQSAFQISTEVDAELLAKVEQLLIYIQDLIKIEAYALLNKTVLTDFVDYAHCFAAQKSLKATVLVTLQMFLKTLDKNDPFIDIINKVIHSLNEDSNLTTQNAKPVFTTPANKKRKKKESSIVNTVVEDGEEFVVVKSNWKFNPKKLTENQKEKLKRKREDIPALYQDLSQSQDEFKLSTWKTDSQDTTTTTSSKSNDLTTSEKVSSILKNIPNTDVVPKILQNILTEKDEKINLSLELKKEHVNDNKISRSKEIKPRLSLKDRIFRNVKLLTENSDLQIEEKHVKAVTKDTTIQLNTPVEMKIKTFDANDNVNSTPSEINTDRPSRVKRKPKKFEEMEIFATKKMRNSQGESQNKDSFEDLHDNQVIKVGEIKLSTPDADISKNLESDKNINQALNLNQDTIKHNNHKTQNKNNFNAVYKQLTQDKNVDDQIESNKSNDVPTTSQIDMGNDASADKSILPMSDKNDKNNTKDDCSNQNISNKKTGKKKSRIEKELAIDMVEGHPFLKAQPEKRLTRNKASESPVISRRKSLTQKLNKSKADHKNTPKVDKKVEEIIKPSDKTNELDTFPDSQESNISGENGSQDFIESSQESTVSIMSSKSSKTPKRLTVVTSENINHIKLADKMHQSSKIVNADSKTVNDSVSSTNDDSEFPLNKTAAEHNIVQIDLTANFDTEPIDKISLDEVIEIEDKSPPIASILNNSYMDMETQDIADADTQPMDSDIINKELDNITACDETKTLDASTLEKQAIDSGNNMETSLITQEDTTTSLTEPLPHAIETNQEADESLSKLSPKDDEQRKQDFLNNTLEISPIKALSPVRDKKSPSPETSSDYDVIKLTSPVQSNGEPFEKCDSPEIFTEEKVSPDKRDQSPPRAETRVNTVSPRSLSLKKNKPQVRSGGRAAQMLGLCIPGPDRLQIQTIVNSEKSVEADEPKKCSPKNSSARRNLRMLYNATNESSETLEETEECDKFLTMSRSLPAADSGPSVPILKRKLVDIADDSTVSPASKRKRVSFHDPPVSTTVCVKKYIESSTVRSPQNSVIRRQERQSLRTKLEASGNLKSQKRLDTEFKLDSALTNAVESFSESNVTSSTAEDTEMSSLEPTPLVEVVKNSDLNDVDPICLDLINCNDPVDNIAGDLSSSAMRPLLVKEFAGKIETVGDLAKLTELEVNRLCIKAPKVQVVKKVLTEYAKKVNVIASEMTPMTEAAFSESIDTKTVDVEMQTDCLAVENEEVQTDALDTSSAHTQTTIVSTVDCDVQTDESGSKSTEDIVKSLLQKPDYSDHLNKLLDVPAKQSIATSLPISVLSDTLVQGIQNEKHHTNVIIDKLLEKHTSDSGQDDNPRLSFMRNYLSERFNSKELILLCSDLLRKIHDSNI